MSDGVRKLSDVVRKVTDGLAGGGNAQKWKSGSEPPKHDTRVYFEGFAFSEKKKLWKSLFENTMENPFFYFLNADRNAQKNYNSNMDNLISNLLSELIFTFGKWSNWKYANKKASF